jgi:hypothetical protein
VTAKQILSKDYSCNNYKLILLNNEMVRITNSQHSTNKIQNEFCAVLGYYTADSGKFLPSFQDKLSVPSAILDPCRWDKLIATLNLDSQNTYVI